MPKDEILMRFNLLNDMVTKKFADRPTYEAMNKMKN